MSLKRIALRHKLLSIYIVFLICTFAVVFTSTLVLNLLKKKEELLTQLQITCQETAEQIAPAVAADQPQQVAGVLAELASNPSIQNLSIVNLETKKVFAEFRRPNSNSRASSGFDGLSWAWYDLAKSRSIQDDFHRFSDNTLEVVSPVILNDKIIGRIYVKSDLSLVRAEIKQALFLAVGINVPCIVLSFLLVRRTLNAISNPITSLAATAAAVAEKQDFSLRAEKFLDDELGQLADAFNKMLAKIEHQNSRLQEQHAKLARAERMQSLGLLAGGVAHDLNNILGPMVAFPEMIIERLEPGDPSREDLIMIGKSARRASIVIQDLLSLARRGSYSREIISLPTLLQECLESPCFRSRVQEFPGIAIAVDLEEDLPPISGSEPHLTQAILNLLFNGLEAMADQGQLTVAAGPRTITSSDNTFEKIEPGEYVVMSIADTGPGIRNQDLEHIFEPFYTSKKMGRKSGSGLGLAVVYGVITDHGAKINVVSRLGAGTTFEVYFQPQNAPVSRTAENPVTHGHERILVVDDYDQQRILTERILQQQGYTTAGAKSGHEALNRIHTERFDLMVLDMIMEDGFDGLDTYREVIQFNPGMKCIIATGFSENERVREALSLGASQCLHKPYTPSALGNAVRDALDRIPAENAA